MIKQGEGKIIFELTPQIDMNGKAISVINNLLDNINQTKPELPNNSRVFFKLKLAESVDSLFVFGDYEKGE